jgi:hypothetical protein
MSDQSLVQAPAVAELSALSFAELCCRIKPGDVIAFSGSDIPSEVVKLATRSEYVHVAIALATQPNLDGQRDILITESHIDLSLPSLGTGKRTLGVQIQWLSQRLAHSQGAVWWAALKSPLAEASLETMQTWLRTQEANQIPYDFVQAIGAGLNAIENIEILSRSDTKALFCSELVTCALQLAGVLDHDLNPAEQTPVDVMGFACFDAPILIR